MILNNQSSILEIRDYWDQNNFINDSIGELFSSARIIIHMGNQRVTGSIWARE